MENVILIDSASSGEVVSTVHGEFSHTNGYFEFWGESGHLGIFWISQVNDPKIIELVTKGSAETCSVARINVPRIEKWVSEHINETH